MANIGRTSPAGAGEAPANLDHLISLIKSGSYEDAVQELRIGISESVDFRYQDKDGWNILHHACNRSKNGNKEAVTFVGRIFQKASSIGISDKDLHLLVNQAENDREKLKYTKSPIHIALDHENRELVKLLLNKGADVNLPECGGKHEVIRRIYKTMPEVLVNVLESHLTWREDEQDAAEQMRIVTWDFSPVTRVLQHDIKTITNKQVIFEKLESQTLLLAHALHEKTVKRSDVLLHPLVQLFIHFKQERFYWPIRISILFHILWSLFSIFFFVSYSQFQPGCIEGENGTLQPDKDAENQCLEEWNPTFNLNNISPNLPFLVVYISICFLSFCKEICEAITSPDKMYYIRQLENWGQWCLLACIPVVWISYLVEMDYMGRSFGTVGIFVSGLLILGQVNKTESGGIYMEILVKVTINVLKFFAFFSPLILTYALIFRLLMPGRDEFWFLGAIPKVVTMMTGEVGFDEVLHGDKAIPHPALVKFVFLCFDLTVIVVLQNLLIGLTLSEIQELKSKAKGEHVAKQLEQIYLIERFLLSSPVKWLFNWMGCHQALMNLMVKPKGTETLSKLPRKLQELICPKMQASREQHDRFRVVN